MKKLLPILLIVVIVFNFIACNLSYADDQQSTTDRYGGDAKLDGDSAKKMSDTGQDSSGNEFKQENFGVSLLGFVMQCVALMINALPIALHNFLTLIVYNVSFEIGNRFN